MFARNIRQILTLAGLLTLTIGSRASAEPGWILEQKNTVGGRSRTWVTRNHYKVQALDSDYITVSSGPKWDRYSYSDRRKICAFLKGTETDDAYAAQAALLKSLVTGTITGMQWTRARSASWKGLKVTVFRSNVDKAPRRGALVLKQGSEYSELWMADEIVLSPQVARALHTLSELIPINRHPLRLIHFRQDGLPDWKLETTSVKQADLKDSVFALPPKSYRPCSVNEILVNTTNLGDIIDP